MYKPIGVKEASEILSMSTSFLVHYDPDIDGAISGELVRRFLEAFNKPYMVYINDNRTHGLRLTDQQIDQLKGVTIILVDAGMTRAEVEMLTSRGVNIINIDHHNIDEENFVDVYNEETGSRGVIINNQYPFEPEEYRFLSGAGVIYYVLECLYRGFCTQEEKMLVGLSLLSDIRPIESEIARDFLHVTYTHKSPLSDYFINLVKGEKDFGFGIRTFDRNFIDYTFAPRINALFRLNNGYDAIDVFRGHFNDPEKLSVSRNIQNAIRDEIITNLQGLELSNLVFKYVDLDSINNPYGHEVTNFVGLACSRVKNDGKTTLLFVRENNKIKRGSVRGFADDVNYLDIFRRHGFKSDGHHNAFGVKEADLDSINLEALNEEIMLKESGYAERKYSNRILKVSNLAFFLSSQNVQFADFNNYVRDNSRVYLKYVGSSYERSKRGKAFEFVVDGVKVLSFEDELTLENGLILPIKERGSYVNFYLRPY